MFGIWGHDKAAEITYYGLHAMQHRGQDGAGIVINNGENLKLHKDVGLVNDVFKRVNFADFPGYAAIGHVRNATQDDGIFDNVQPLVFRSLSSSTAIAHNGRIMNAEKIRRNLEEAGSIFQTTSDTEVLAHLMKKMNGKNTTEEAIIAGLKQLVGAYAFLILTEDKMYVALDPRGIRPLSLGRLGDAYVVASETCAFSIIGATFEREVMPGELLTISNEGLKSTRFLLREPRKLCAMEYVYFSRPDSDLNLVNVHTSRKRMGIELAREHPVYDADVVTGVPDSSISAAIGYAEQCGLPYEMGVIKNRYIGRTFIQPSQELRDQGVKMKLSPVRGVVEGKSVVMIDDSIVRGTTSRRIVRLLKEAGAKEVHVRISSPRIENPCLYGIDMLTKKELIAANHTNEEIKDIIEADSVEFLSIEGTEKAIVKDKTINQGICAACMTGNYPVLENDQRKEFYRKY
ncbi:amidophosphoribosyltransferase [Pseudogracilibacillus auburnensis]|uniref:Amidophosphoribosyltransferase n=1 Tax=Pseudogracilibacillus auburnensis TaxID=1494959 RepID=A0A2V3WBM6_9BACI|nr:amidophosphoribosyltransferase [Pseudogracilibacillus auburnensis]MBO1001175.1 amidophosphoribosyltransferase [Pseudogracilibacillus auburnensis]PXW90608.1 amidophosphoribosyltransferase [Pseudogracilibacillus auburnensis]